MEMFAESQQPEYHTEVGDAVSGEVDNSTKSSDVAVDDVEWDDSNSLSPSSIHDYDRSS